MFLDQVKEVLTIPCTTVEDKQSILAQCDETIQANLEDWRPFLPPQKGLNISGNAMTIPGMGGEGAGMDEDDFLDLIQEEGVWQAFLDHLNVYRSHVQKSYLQERTTFGSVVNKKRTDKQEGKGRPQDWMYGTREVKKDQYEEVIV